MALPIVAQCEDSANYLQRWHVWPYDDGKVYEVKTRFDGDRLKVEDLQGRGNSLADFAEIDAGELWGAETFTIEGLGETLTFDTVQLKRMFPTEQAFCDGEKPKSN